MRYNDKENKQIESINFNAIMPMEFFTPEEMRPSEQTLKLIRQIAYTYRVFKNSGKPQVFCLN